MRRSSISQALQAHVGVLSFGARLLPLGRIELSRAPRANARAVGQTLTRRKISAKLGSRSPLHDWERLLGAAAEAIITGIDQHSLHPATSRRAGGLILARSETTDDHPISIGSSREEAAGITRFPGASAHEAVHTAGKSQLTGTAVQVCGSPFEGFEESHPTVVRIVNLFATALSNMGF
jgi:hypothetical protein